MRFLSKKEELEILSGPHCFSGLNYAQKTESTSQRVRPVAYSSLYHPSSSLNSRLPVGPSFIGSLRAIFTNFRLKSWALVFNMSRAYRSMRADYTAVCLRLQWYPVDPYDDNNSGFCVILYNVVTYGDSLAALCLELIAARS